MSVKVLNQDEQSSKRLKFARLSDRLDRISVGVDVKQLISSKENESPNVQQELDRLRELDTTTEFRRFYYKLWPLIQSLPEILHHQQAVVDSLIDRVENVSDDSLPSVLKLIASLAKDLQEDILPHFHSFMTALLRRLHTSYKDIHWLNPELAGNIVESMSYLIKYVTF